jgi:endonuclease-3
MHGRYVCVARKPKCPICIIADICRYKNKTEMLVKEPAPLVG